jgi:hypothetical protein
VGLEVLKAVKMLMSTFCVLMTHRLAARYNYFVDTYALHLHLLLTADNTHDSEPVNSEVEKWKKGFSGYFLQRCKLN